MHDTASNPRFYAPWSRLAGQYKKAASAAADEVRRDRGKALKEALASKSSGVNTACRILRPAAARPLHAVKRTEPGANGEPTGSITTDPTQVDEEVRRAWANIYKGNAAGRANRIAKS